MDEKIAPRAKGRSDPGWVEDATAVFSAVMARHGSTLKELQKALAERGLAISYKSLSTKVNRGTFSFAFFLEAMDALGVRSVLLSKDVEEHVAKRPSDRGA